MKKKIALLCCGWAYDFLLSFLEGLKKAGKNKNIDIYIFCCYPHDDITGLINFTCLSIFDLVDYKNFDGVIIFSDLIGNPQALEKERLKILKSGIPAVSINADLDGISTFRVDNYSAFYELINHLIKEHNLKEIAYVKGYENNLDFNERYQAYTKALEDNNISVDYNLIFTVDRSNIREGYRFGKEYFSYNKNIPQAFVCATDFIAFGVLQAAQNSGLQVPNDIKIIGFDNHSLASIITPSLSTVQPDFEVFAFEVLDYLLSGSKEVIKKEIPSKVFYRETCGCVDKQKDAQKNGLRALADLRERKDVFNQIALLDDVFTDATDVFTLLTDLEVAFVKSHLLEGSDFCIFLNSDWSSILINSAENLPSHISYGTQVQSIVSIQNNKKYPREIINTCDLIPTKMQADESSFYVFLPIFNHSYVHGYFVAKNNFNMIDNHYGYTWTKTLGNSIERFRKKNMYKQMSQQLLKMSVKDSLTGTYNRVGLEKFALPFYAQNKKNGLTTLLYFVDINKMKIINDKFGHLHGDLAIKTVSSAMLEVIPKNWIAIRYGGDEFLILGNNQNYNNEDYSSLITQRLSKKTEIMRLPYELSASIGTYSVTPNSILSLEQALEKVDEIMYIKKQEYHKLNG